MGKPKAPQAPNYDKLLEMSRQNIQANTHLFNRYMDYTMPLARAQEKRAADQWRVMRPEARAQAAFANQMRKRYLAKGVPLEDQYARKLRDWDTPQRRAEAAAQARQDVGATFEAQRENQMRQLESYGIDPSQVRAASLDQRLRTQQALGQATASTQARRQIEKEGVAMMGEAVNIYKGLPATSAAALGAGAATSASLLNGTGAAAQLGMQAYGLGAGMLAQNNKMATDAYGTANDIYGNQLQGWEVQMANSPLNTAAGLFGTFLGAGGGIPGFSEGGYVHPDMSPTKGAIPDDVPAMVSAGEVILPDEVVRYHGLKTLNKLADEARQAMGTAIPEGAQ